VSIERVARDGSKTESVNRTSKVGTGIRTREDGGFRIVIGAKRSRRFVVSCALHGMHVTVVPHIQLFCCSLLFSLPSLQSGEYQQ
jgi:hypothetical protein